MLWFERQVVSALVVHLDGAHRRVVEDHVDGALLAMPQHLRAGLAGQSVLLGALARLRGRGEAVAIESLDNHPVGLVRQYVRALRSLVLLAEHELAPA